VLSGFPKWEKALYVAAVFFSNCSRFFALVARVGHFNEPEVPEKFLGEQYYVL